MFHPKKIYIFVSLILLILLTKFLFSSPSAPPEDTLTIGLQSGYPPFEFMNEQGEIVGFDVELAHLIAQKLDKTLVIKDMEFEGEILSLKQGKIDLIISGMSITPSRLKEIDMIPYHGEALEKLCLIFWKEIPSVIDSLETFAKHAKGAISVETGSISESYLNLYPQIQAKSFQGSLAPLMDVKYGKSLANLVGLDVARYLQTQHPEVKILEIPLTKDQTIMGCGIGVNKNNRSLFASVETIIQDLKVNGELNELEKKWFKGGSE